MSKTGRVAARAASGHERGYWQKFANLAREIRAFIAAHGRRGYMPSKAKLRSSGYSSLEKALRYHGGLAAVANRLSLKLANGRGGYPKGYWRDFANLTQEIRDFIAAHGQPGEMPHGKTFRAQGRYDIANHVGRHGGTAAVARRMGLHFTPLARTGRPLHYWADFNNLALELTQWISRYGSEGDMPSARELREHGREDLVEAVRRHHGFGHVARELGLCSAAERRRGSA